MSAMNVQVGEFPPINSASSKGALFSSTYTWEELHELIQLQFQLRKHYFNQQNHVSRTHVVSSFY